MSATSASPESNAHHGLAVHEVVLLLDTDPDAGLSEREARRRLERYGPNVLPAPDRGGVILRIARQFHSPLVYVLIASGAITAALGELVDSSVIFGVVLVNAVIGFIQESKAEAELDALRSLVLTEARVVREGVERMVASTALVPGDLVLVQAGDKVPADLRLLRTNELRIDESALTGESVPVTKDEVVLPDHTPVSDRRNMLYSGTLVTSGMGAGVTVATGAGTELGEIYRLVGSAERLATPLTRKLNWFSKLLTVVILALAAVTFAIGVARGQDTAQTFTAAVALAVGAIPEGLPAAVTITLAIGVARMARRRAVIRRLPAVETLGSTTVVCSDKTGTLTENEMTVRVVWTPQQQYDVTVAGVMAAGVTARVAADRDPGADEALRWCLVAGVGCNDASLTREDGHWQFVGDPTEGALLVAAGKAGISPDSVAAAYPRAETIPFSSGRQYMTTLHDDHATGSRLAMTKGATERVLDLCSSQMTSDGSAAPLDASAVLAEAHALAATGLRVLACAIQRLGAGESFTEQSHPTSMTLVGLQAMMDPPRPAAAAAIRTCHEAGVAVKMVTGDHVATATAIAGRLGLLEDRRHGDVLTGEDLARLRPEEYPGAVEQASVLARVSPEQKLRMVQALQSRRHVVAMTGDGVNDAPALQQADIGIAMGRGGTEVAKEAADMVLTDDDFATIEAAVEEGRGVFDNLTKFIVWTLPTNMAEGLVILVAILLGVALPILPTQILWINMTTAVALGLMLAFEPGEPGTMQRPPRDPQRPLLTGPLVGRILLVSALLVGGAWWVFEFELQRGAELAEARTAALNLFVAVEAFYLFSCRSLTRSAWRVGLFSNRWLIGGVSVQVVGQLAITYLPVMNQLFHTAPIDAAVWLRILAVSVVATLVVAVHKRLRGRAL